MSYQLIQGDARRIPLDSGSVHCVVTSPPYFSLRDYGTAEWVGGDPACDHKDRPVGGSFALSTLGPKRDGLGPDNSTWTDELRNRQFRDFCRLCGARRVDRQIGLEPSPAEYVAALVQVGREIRRVLRDDGTFWLNLGSNYAGTSMASDSWKLRDDLTPAEIRYVLSELAIAQGGTSSDPG